jgi:hypothetical protein
MYEKLLLMDPTMHLYISIKNISVAQAWAAVRKVAQFFLAAQFFWRVL